MILELVFEVVFQLIAGFFYVFFGALVGVLWPAKTPDWASKQRWGIAAGLSALILFGLSIGFMYVRGWGKLEGLLLLLAALLLICYLVLGNICRSYHEAAYKEENSGN